MSKPSNLRIEDTTASTARADLNDILISIASLQTTDGDGTAYTGAPTTTYPNMFWYDKATSILKLRTTADDAWINVAYVDQSSNAYRILDDTQVTNTSGTQTGLLGDQATATWESGVGTTESLISPVKLSSAVISNEASSKAWSAISGAGTPVIDNSFNITSLTDNGTGLVTFNITNSFSSANYSALGGGQRGDAAQQSVIVGHINKTTSSTQFQIKDDNGISYDLYEGSFAWNGDLA
jgi:hypothetical protein